MNDIAARSDRDQDRLDSGFTLIELIVAMLIFAIFTTIFLTAVIGLTRGASRVETTATTTNGVLVVFQTLDRQIRYADAVNLPGSGASGARYLEFRIPASSAADEVTTCRQWRYVPSDGRLQVRQWTDAAGSSPTPWATKLVDVIPRSGTYPFAVIPAPDSGGGRQQVVITVEAGTADGAGTEIETRFVARNSSVASLGNIDSDKNGVSDNPACQRSEVRP